MHCYLSNDGYILKKDKLSNEEISIIKKDLTLSPIVIKAYSNFVKPPILKLYKDTPNYYIVPRFYGIQKYGKPVKEALSIGESMNYEVKFIYKLLDHQHTAVKNTLERLNSTNGGILSLPCGYGKTGISIYLSILLGRKTGVIVNKECLADQWIDAINKFTDKKAKIGRIQQDIYDIEGKDFVICMVHTFVKRDILKSDMNKFGMFIVDECHHMGSEMFSQALPKLGCRYLLGLSATPTRKDGLSDVFFYYLGSLCHSEKRSANNNVCVKRLILSSNSSEYETLMSTTGVKNTSGMVTNLSSFKNRNDLIVNIIRILMENMNDNMNGGRKILLLSERREHLQTLYKYLENEKINIYDINIKSYRPITFGYYYGNNGTNKKDHKILLENSAKCDIILGTHQLASEGLDIPDLNTEIIATPRSDVEQAVGRILRKFHKVVPLVIDLVDDCGNFKSQSTNRNKLYKSEDYTINTIKIDLDDINTYSTNNTNLKNHLTKISNKLEISKEICQNTSKNISKNINDSSDEEAEENEKITKDGIKNGECLL